VSLKLMHSLQRVVVIHTDMHVILRANTQRQLQVSKKNNLTP